MAKGMFGYSHLAYFREVENRGEMEFRRIEVPKDTILTTEVLVKRIELRVEASMLQAFHGG